ncbi:FAD assembly factor SdhE [Oceanibium sediminis]|uniref:FAD assembly factor SdhE n=1 Tax=Oceanibium sediminis TaxID=2026339 RepID=UPI0018E58C44|nr:succinate dehydrogenase assembly factor 2 [Oceanibium sediminis]
METSEHRLKRLRLRSWRRGTKEMDLILGPFADKRLADLGAGELAAYEAMIEENDQDLYRWMTGQQDAPPVHAPLVVTIRMFHGIT